MTETLPAVPDRNDEMAIMERVLLVGDLEQLSAQERVQYYAALCHSLKLNPMSRPFEYLKLSGKLVLYARKDCAEQLRRLHQVSITGLSGAIEGDLYVVTATAQTPAGRTDMDQGAVTITGLRGEALANARLKATTKAKRRVTLSLCGLGMMDETEVEAIPDARRVRVDESTGEILEPPAALPPPAAAAPPPAARPAPKAAPEPSERDRAKLEYGKLAYRASQLKLKLPPLPPAATVEEIREMIADAEEFLNEAEARPEVPA